MMRNEPLVFIGCDTSYKSADTVIFGAPFDGTASFRPGARFGPQDMRVNSDGIETYSPYQDKDLADLRICDTGDLPLPFGNTAVVLSAIEQYTKTILSDGKRPVMIGGEHLVTLGAVRAAAEAYPDLCILHFDAHADLRDTYLGEKLSHATVMRRVWDILGDGRIYQFGIRSGDREEIAWGKEHVSTRFFDCDTLATTVAALSGHPVYLTVDLDVIDPSELPGTGTPEAGGVSTAHLIDCLKMLSGLHIVAADISELSPPCDPGGISTMAACKVLRELLLAVCWNNRH